MAAAAAKQRSARLPPEVNRCEGRCPCGASRRGSMRSCTRAALHRVLFVRNLPFNISSEEMYGERKSRRSCTILAFSTVPSASFSTPSLLADIFGKYGAIRQVRM
jgi:hypothetical protein